MLEVLVVYPVVFERKVHLVDLCMEKEYGNAFDNDDWVVQEAQICVH